MIRKIVGYLLLASWAALVHWDYYRNLAAFLRQELQP